MKILLTAATPPETAAIRSHFGMPLLEPGKMSVSRFEGLEISLLHTGIGMVNTAWHLGRAFQSQRPDLALQFGIAGAFPGGLDLLDVVEVVEDCYAELGADSPEGFLPLDAMGFPSFVLDGQPVYNRLFQPRPPLAGLRSCRGVTVNRVSGASAAIAEMQQIWAPEVETMEGAAFFQACLMEGVPFRALRAVSNRVEPRNRAAWQLKEAVEAMQQHLLGLLQGLEQGGIAL